MSTLLQDIKYGLRMLIKNRGVTVIAVITLALGIGANTAIFSLVYALLLRPLPYPHANQILYIQNADSGGVWPVTQPEFVEFHEQSKSFDSMAALSWDWVSLTGSAEPLRILASITSAEYLNVLGLQPSMGRWFTADEDRSGNNHVVVIGTGLWKRIFGGDSKILGKAITLNGVPHTVIGVMPAEFQFLDDRVELWLPLAIDPAKFDETAIVNHNINVIGRLKPDIHMTAATAEMTGIVQGMKRKYPKHYSENNRIHLEPIRNVLVGNVKKALLLLFGAVGFVLLIACSNVANLFMAKSEARQKEIAIRTALGANVSQIVRLLFVETTMLAIIGGLAGLLFAFWSLDTLLAFSPTDTLGLKDFRIDSTVLGFTLLISIVSGMLFGLAPAFQVGRSNIQLFLKEGGRGMTSGVRGKTMRRFLVISEIALASVLVIGAALLLKSFYKLQQVSPGFQTENVLMVRFDLPENRYPQTEQAAAFYRQMLDRIESIPVVQSAAQAVFVPLYNSDSNWGFEIEGRHDEGVRSAFYNLVSDHYFETLEIPLIKGRFLSRQDQERSEGAVVINETMARRFWPNENPIGKRINVNLGPEIWREIVGVVGDVKNSNLRNETDSQMYFPLIEVPFASIRMGSLIVKTKSNPLSIVSTIKSEIQSMDRNLPLANVQTMDQILSTSVDQARFTSVLLALFACIALILAIVGIYGLISYSVAQRTHEIGVRMVLGARKKQILGLVVGQGLMLVAIGLTVGISGAILLTRLMSSLLFEVSSTDPAIYIAISFLLGCVALAASYIPARKAARVDPMIALRYE
jgi:putative ABC transport system permease protein